MSARANRHQILSFAVALVVLVGNVAPGGAEGLTDTEFTGYLAWLTSLVSPSQADTAAGPSVPLYPFDLAGEEARTSGAEPAAEAEPNRHAEADLLVATGRGLIDLEHQLRSPRARRELSATDALEAARQYRQAAEYDSALAWYARASQRDAAGALRSQISRESLASAIALGDSAVVARQVLRCLAEEPGEAETVIVLRHLIARGDQVNLSRLTAAARGREPQSPDLAVWLAFGNSALGDWPACLASLRAILERGGPAAELSPSLRAWVLVAVPDMLYLAGEPDAAAPLYRALAASEIPGVVTWARLQVANLDLLGGRSAAANTAFTALCAEEATEPWRAFACEMAQHTEILNRFGAEAKPDAIANDDAH